MDQVAFFRNVNQGQRGHPQTAALLAAFAKAGADHAVAFQSNGTVVFTAGDPAEVAKGALEVLAAQHEYEGLVFVRPLAFIEDVVARHSGQADFGRRELSLFAGDHSLGEGSWEQEGRRRECAVADHGPGWAVVVNARDGNSNGTPTVEATLGIPASSRGLPTLVRLVDRFSRKILHLPTLAPLWR